MKRILTAAAIALLASTAAQADNMTKIYGGGNWATYHMAKNAGGKPMCMITGAWTFRDGAKSDVMLKYSNEHGLFMHLSKTTWSFEPGLDVTLAISFDGGYREGTGNTTKSQTTGQPMLETSIPSNVVEGFLEDFANARMMTITFKSGNEPPWSGRMDGSRDAVKAFTDCMTSIIIVGAAARATSPVGPKATSPVAPKAISPVAPKSQPVIAKPKDNGSI